MLNSAELRNLLNRVVVAFVRLFGTRVVDRRTGQRGKKFFAFAWGGKIQVIGLEEPVLVQFEPQERLTYWKQELGFRSVGELDERRVAVSLREEKSDAAGGEVAVFLLAHGQVDQVRTMQSWWLRNAGVAHAPVCYGGVTETFELLRDLDAVLIRDSKLRTRDHQRDFQSYGAILKAACEWTVHHPEVGHVLFAEYDHVPLVSDYLQRMLERMNAEDADLLCHKFRRIDGTSHPHYLYHEGATDFLSYWKRTSVRDDPNVVLSMLGCCFLMRREVLAAVSALKEPERAYMELFIPTAAHHLGYRVQGLPDQEEFVRNRGDWGKKWKKARDAGAWAVHPWKRRWENRAARG